MGVSQDDLTKRAAGLRYAMRFVGIPENTSPPDRRLSARRVERDLAIFSLAAHMGDAALDQGDFPGAALHYSEAVRTIDRLASDGHEDAMVWVQAAADRLAPVNLVDVVFARAKAQRRREDA